jgi:hypothetical protein
LSRRQVIRRIEASADLKELVDDLRQSLVDDAESCIASKIREGDVKTAQWLLLCSAAGRSRGYSKTIDQNQPDDSSCTAQIVEVIVDTPEQVRKILNYEEFEEMANQARRR